MVEGEKMVMELATGIQENHFRIQEIFATPEWIERRAHLLTPQKLPLTEAPYGELKKVSNLITPQEVMALVSIPSGHFSIQAILHTPVLAFESIRDPGNLGTIIRTADWFGIRHIVCTPDSTDLYNPKVVQSTMGAITRVQVHYQELEPLLKSKEIQDKKQFLAPYMEGENIYETRLEPDPLILFGNESHGLSQYSVPIYNRRYPFPPSPPDGPGIGITQCGLIGCSGLLGAEKKIVAPTQSGS